MKRLALLLLCFVLIAELVAPLAFAQDRRRSRFGRKARTVAIIGGGTAAGALIGGKKGAAIGAGASTIYAVNRRAARRHFKRGNRRAATVAGGTVAGAGLGATLGGKKATVAGALLGAGASYIYTRKSRSYRRRRN